MKDITLYSWLYQHDNVVNKTLLDKSNSVISLSLQFSLFNAELLLTFNDVSLLSGHSDQPPCITKGCWNDRGSFLTWDILYLPVIYILPEI